MAFMGLFLIGVFFFLIIIGVLLSIFIPCLIISIINLVQGIKNKWPKRNIITLSITGSITALFFLLFIFILFAYLTNSGSEAVREASESYNAALIIK